MSEEQALLIQRARDSIKAAKLLADEGLFYAFAISRAYYAMLYIAEAFLLEKEFAFSKHSAVISAFGKHFAKTGKVPKEFHRFLLEGFDNRTVSDYDIKADFSKQEAKEQIERAQQFLDFAQKTLAPEKPG